MVNIKKKRCIFIFIVFLFVAAPLVYKIALLNKSNKQVPAPEADHQKPSPYGDFLCWQEVNILFPKYARATVIDCETGLKFRVQRRAGQYHADVQPLTAEDTAVMKGIYNGK